MFETTKSPSATANKTTLRTQNGARLKSNLQELRHSENLAMYLHQQIKRTRVSRPIETSLKEGLISSRVASTAISRKKRYGPAIASMRTEATPKHKKCRSRQEENMLGPESMINRRDRKRPYAGSQYV
eukprot:CAMPEP_0185574746 /NCGR_PEP_ID=MMETSP0434-20130131/6123_1 /TAXON_ID=626734 ORGANISM="Favella taraikaensis, Strain Fe Narragansett Bay" /NCGR_SAMPLE_ID=MMETSP0434 /ASSEMBLY_ACC=CAM_ASM_000379 /LENGTH=127 /DNA_ID=CAMNT_0028191405 /DNA_START=1599 /DNA_END=1982 /DNA_ORIENTATION=+